MLILCIEIYTAFIATIFFTIESILVRLAKSSQVRNKNKLQGKRSADLVFDISR